MDDVDCPRLDRQTDEHVAIIRDMANYAIKPRLELSQHDVIICVAGSIHRLPPLIIRFLRFMHHCRIETQKFVKDVQVDWIMSVPRDEVRR